ncbi:MAG: HAD-IA family hydrolase [Firmicutes bacterium]|nr:HAD-IA family hydrolase [Bacillota bacterium]
MGHLPSSGSGRYAVAFGSAVFNVTGVLFDKDGVIIDGLALCYALHQARRAVVERDFGPVAAAWYDRLMEVHGQCAQRGAAMLASLAEAEVLMTWAIRHASHIDWDEARERARQLTQEADRAVKLSDAPLTMGARGALTALKRHGVAIGMVTADASERTWAQLEYWKIRDFFDVVVTEDDVTRGKPDPACVIKAVELLGLDCTQVVLVGDSPNDWRMAAALGMPCVAVSAAWPAGFPAVRATIPNLAQISVVRRD